MSRPPTTANIEALLARGAWRKARGAIRRGLAGAPRDHWLRTQLGVTYYEERNYAEALTHFLASLKLVADCPLTIWNLAGALDALGQPEQAIARYQWILDRRTSTRDDPCWESAAWTAALQTDCLYRLGVCCEHQGDVKNAAAWFRRYAQELRLGKPGSYPPRQVRTPSARRGAADRRRGRTSIQLDSVALQKVKRLAEQLGGVAPARAALKAYAKLAEPPAGARALTSPC